MWQEVLDYAQSKPETVVVCVMMLVVSVAFWAAIVIDMREAEAARMSALRRQVDRLKRRRDDVRR